MRVYKSFKAILIVPRGNGRGYIKEVRISPDTKIRMKEISTFLECSIFDCAKPPKMGNNTLFLDDEGLCKTYEDDEGNEIYPPFFTINGMSFAGNALILGDDENGETTSTDINLHSGADFTNLYKSSSEITRYYCDAFLCQSDFSSEGKKHQIAIKFEDEDFNIEPKVLVEAIEDENEFFKALMGRASRV